MTNIDWHAERSDLPDLVLVDAAPEPTGIDLRAVRLYRQARVRREREWARGTTVLTDDLVGTGATVGVERLNGGTVIALTGCGLNIVDAHDTVERARAIKSPDEIKCVRTSLGATERAVCGLRDAIRPGLTENELWSVLHRSVIAGNGDYCETRLLNSGPCTNPWFQESCTRTIGANELIALDTDVVGCHGYYSDFSRTIHAGPDKPTDAQHTLYRVAHEQAAHNMELIRPGTSFSDYADHAWTIPERYRANRYYLSAHGCGMTGEYPYLYHRADFPDAGYDREIEPGMTICVERYFGEEGGCEGGKLEQQLLVTEDGYEGLSTFPFEQSLLG